MYRALICWLVLLTLTGHLPATYAEPLNTVTLRDLVSAALRTDPWLTRSHAEERARRNAAISAGALPDPKLSLAVANLPTDSFEFSQEPMSQVVVGFSQAFPAGKTRSLRREKMLQMGDMNPIERAVREAQLQRQMTALWLKAAFATLSIDLINDNHALFVQLLDVTRAGYSSTVRRVNQQDVIRAELELTGLEERVMRLTQQREESIQQLRQWVPISQTLDTMDWSLDQVTVSTAVHDTTLLQHPEVLLIDQQARVLRVDRQLADEEKRPGWSLNTSYAHRDTDFNGRELPDFVSVGVTLDLPLFTSGRQDQNIAAASERISALESTRLLKLRELQARLADAGVTSVQLQDQHRLYREKLLPQIDSLSQSTLDAYGSDRADFADVMRAYITRLNASINKLRIETELAERRNELIYLTTVYDPSKEH